MRTIASLPTSLRPREKLLRLGAQALSMEELIAVLFITGTKTMPVSRIANQLAKKLNKEQISSIDLASLALGPSKTAQLLAALELGTRYAKKKPATPTSADQIYAMSFDIISSTKESLACFYLNARGEVVKREVLAVGALNRVNILPREIFSHILNAPVASIILVHNHPSENLEPSDDDIVFTARVQAAADIIGITLLDHLIVGKAGWNRVPKQG